MPLPLRILTGSSSSNGIPRRRNHHSQGPSALDRFREGRLAPLPRRYFCLVCQSCDQPPSRPNVAHPRRHVLVPDGRNSQYHWKEELAGLRCVPSDLPTSNSLSVFKHSHKVAAQNRRAPIFFDVLHNKFRCLVVWYIRPILGVIQAVSQVADEYATDSPFGHLLDGERPIQHTHIRVDAHHQQVLNRSLSEQTINLVAVVGD